MKEIMIENFATKYVKDRRVIIRPSTYGNNGNLALQVFDAADGHPLVTASVNPVDGPLPKGLVAIKGWSENEGVPKALVDAGIIEKDFESVISQGFVDIYVYKLTEKARDAFEV